MPSQHANGVAKALNHEFARQVPEAMVAAFGPPAIPGLGTGSGFTMQLQDLSGGTPEYLAEQAQKFMPPPRERPEIGRISTVYRSSVPQIYADIDRSKVLKTGVSLGDVNTTLGALLGSSYVNDFNRFGRVYKVYVQAEPEFRQDPDQLGLFFVRSDAGEMVPLNTLVSTSPPVARNSPPASTCFAPRRSPAPPRPVTARPRPWLRWRRWRKGTLPADMGYQWADMSYQEKASPNPIPFFALAILLVFLILAAQYESWSLPFSVLLGTPFAAFGAFFGLWLMGLFSSSYVNNVFAQIGLIMLIGLAAKNAILIVEFARMQQEQGKNRVQAALEAAKLRFRPILMTSFAFILGVIPLLTASGAGAEARKVMGITVFSGMLFATIVGVCLVPVLFVAVEKIGGSAERVKQRYHGSPLPTSRDSATGSTSTDGTLIWRLSFLQMSQGSHGGHRAASGQWLHVGPRLPAPGGA